MKKIPFYSIITGIILMGSQIAYGCPYQFINDSGSSVILAEIIEHAYLVKPDDQVTLVAPMNPEHEKMHETRGTVAGEHRDTEEEESNGHAPFYVYIKNGNQFDAVFKIRERACGLGSMIKYSQLEGMANGTVDAGRFAVKVLTPERAEAKKAKLTAFKK